MSIFDMVAFIYCMVVGSAGLLFCAVWWWQHWRHQRRDFRELRDFEAWTAEMRSWMH